jgi:hypothetical protein
LTQLMERRGGGRRGDERRECKTATICPHLTAERSVASRQRPVKRGDVDGRWPNVTLIHRRSCLLPHIIPTTALHTTPISYRAADLWRWQRARRRSRRWSAATRALAACAGEWTARDGGEGGRGGLCC